MAPLKKHQYNIRHCQGYLISSRRNTSLLLYKLLTMRSMRRLTCHHKETEDTFNKETKPGTKTLKSHSSLNDIPQLDTHISQQVVRLLHPRRRLQQWTHTGCRQSTSHFSSSIELWTWQGYISRRLTLSAI